MNILLLLALPPLAQALPTPPPTLQPFSYRLKLESTEQETCAEHAARLGIAFARATPAQAVVASCQLEQNGQDTIVISYRAERAQVPYRAIYGGNPFLSDGQANAGVFATLDACKQAAAEQAPSFALETGLEVFASYCTPSTQQFHPGYSLTIEGFGQPKNRLYTFARSYADDGRFEQTLAAAERVITESKARIIWRGAEQLFYYNSGPVRVTISHLGSFDVESQCTSQVDEARNIFVRAKLVAPAAFCESRTVGGTDKVLHTLIAVAGGSHMIQDDFGHHSPSYDSFEECGVDIGRVMQSVQGASRTVYGGVCARDLFAGKGFKAYVYYQY